MLAHDSILLRGTTTNIRGINRNTGTNACRTFDRRPTTTARHTELGLDTCAIGFTNESRLFSRKENLREDKYLHVARLNEKRVALLRWKFFFLQVAVAIRFDMEGKAITIVDARPINASRKRFHSFENR